MTDRRVRQLWAEHNATGRVPELRLSGRPRSACWSAYASIVTAAFAKHRCGSVALGGVMLDEPEIDLRKQFDTTGPTVREVQDFIKQKNRARALEPNMTMEYINNNPEEYEAALKSWELNLLTANDIRNDYDRYKEIFDPLKSNFFPDGLPRISKRHDGIGHIYFWFGGGATKIAFGGWSSYQIPDLVLSGRDAVETAIEFSKTDGTFAGPGCGLSIKDRSVDPEPRYVHPTLVAGTPFWRVDMGPCDLSRADVVILVDALTGRPSGSRRMIRMTLTEKPCRIGSPTKTYGSWRTGRSCLPRTGPRDTSPKLTGS